jgi:hypothetical protein
VVEAGLSGLEDGEVDAELGELDRRVAVLVLEGAARASALREPPLGVACVEDEPAVGDGREARPGVPELRFAQCLVTVDVDQSLVADPEVVGDLVEDDASHLGPQALRIAV